MTQLKSLTQIIREQREEYLMEAVRYSDFPKACKLIRNYLARHIGKVFYYPSPEIVHQATGTTIVGIRFFVLGNKSFRLNWRRGQLSSSVGIISMDYWDGSKIPQRIPTKHIDFEVDASMARVLPFVRDFLQGKVTEKSGTYIEDVQQVVNEGRDVYVEALTRPYANMLTEGKAYTDRELTVTVQNMVKAFEKGVQIRQQQLNGGNTKYGPCWHKAQAVVRELYAELFKSRAGSKQKVISPADAKKIDVDRVVAGMSGKGVKFAASAGKPEDVDVPGASEEDVERMTYEEQLDALRTGMKLLMSNATYAMFVGGRGGTGKTVTIEDMLHAAGKTDGNGYYQITGSASPSGIYRVLHTYRNDILLFDDCDDALMDQEGRNLFKAAADTKKVRKISWLKGGKQFVDPDFYDEEEDDDKLPRSFEFTGKIIFISNLPLRKLDPDGALRTRGYVMSVDPTNTEIYDFMMKIAPKVDLSEVYEEGGKKLSAAARFEVVEVLRSRPIPEKSADLRQLVRALRTRSAVEGQGGSAQEWVKFVKTFA